MAMVASSAIVGALIGRDASRKAANTQADAQRDAMVSNQQTADKQIAAQREMFDIQNNLQKPFREIGLGAQNRLMEMLTGKYSKDFGMQDFQQDPGYAFRLQEGMKALNANAAARGGLISGNALKAAQRYGQDMASQEYQNAFNRYQINRANQLQPWQSLAGVGQSATNALSGAVGQMGQGISGAYAQMGQGNAQAYGNIGDARASGYVGAANAINSGIGNYLNYRQGQDLLNSMNNTRGSSYEPYGPPAPYSGSGWGMSDGDRP